MIQKILQYMYPVDNSEVSKKKKLSEVQTCQAPQKEQLSVLHV